MISLMEYELNKTCEAFFLLVDGLSHFDKAQHERQQDLWQTSDSASSLNEKWMAIQLKYHHSTSAQKAISQSSVNNRTHWVRTLTCSSFYLFVHIEVKSKIMLHKYMLFVFAFSLFIPYAQRKGNKEKYKKYTVFW